MTDHSIRFFSDDAAVRRIGEGLLDRSLPKADWTHEAHLAACLWLLVERPDVVPERDLPRIIPAYNEAVGTANTDTSGYHETLTQLYARAIRDFAGKHPVGTLTERVNALLASPVGPRDWPFEFYPRERLFSHEARRAWIEPDLAPFLPDNG